MTTSDTKIVVLDVETTGKERSRDQIIEVCLQGGLGIEAGIVVWRIRPSVPIHPEATAVHGITEADLQDQPLFSDVAQRITAILADAQVIVGYNVAFDVDMIQAELERARLPLLDLASKQVVDVLRLWHHVEPRTLVAAHEKFLGWAMADAHAASADVAATGRVLSAMIERFDLGAKSWPELAAIANPFSGREKWIGPSHHLQWDGDAPVFAFGKNRGLRIDQVDPGFLMWMLGKDFPKHVKEVCAAATRMRGEQLTAWIVERFPRARTIEISEVA